MKLSDFLEPDERDAVLGDLAESGASWIESAIEIAGLLARRQRYIWIGSIAAALCLTFAVTPLGGVCDLCRWVLRNYADMDPATLAENHLTPLDVSVRVTTHVLPIAVGTAIAGFNLARFSHRTLSLNTTLFLVVSTLVLRPSTTSLIFPEAVCIWLPLFAGTQIRRTL